MANVEKKLINLPEELVLDLKVEAAELSKGGPKVTVEGYVDAILNGEIKRDVNHEGVYKSEPRLGIRIVKDIHDDLMIESTRLARVRRSRVTLKSYVMMILNGEIERDQWYEQAQPTT